MVAMTELARVLSYVRWINKFRDESNRLRVRRSGCGEFVYIYMDSSVVGGNGKLWVYSVPGWCITCGVSRPHCILKYLA